MAKTVTEHLTDYLKDAYAIEQQALAQLRTAPDIAGESTFATHLHQHLEETETQASRLERRLEAYDESPSKLKDAVMALGGKGFLLFARVQPDTPGKLAAHSYSYEALEWASYDLLTRMAETASDRETATVARAIRDEERTMMERIASTFDEVVDASLDEVGTAEIAEHLKSYLADAHALEAQAEKLLARGEDLAGAPELETIYREQLAASREHARRIEERLESCDGDTSKVKDLALQAAGLEWSLFFQAQKDTPGKLAAFVYALGHLKIAGYELLRRVADRAGDTATATLAAEAATQERTMAERLSGAFDQAFQASMEALEVTA